MSNFKGKTVIVTGAANGIGQGIAEAFAKKEANVVIADINEEKGRKLEESMKQQGISSLFIKADVKDETEISRLMAKSREAFGSIDILINNAGISKFYSFFDMTVEMWDEVINTNLRSVFLCSREAAKKMNAGSSIINISSTRAEMSESNTEAYSASKGGVSAITHALARTLAEKGIRVNCISPGWIETEDYEELREIDHKQHLANRVGKPEDIARTCLFLADPESDFITGENITVDGGMTKKMIYEH
ncbi:SDR family oxidoreductase [Bacillus sp. ISL-47]|uniref:SDR family oxidoreductase n=1 Tax=Bacillus sp. ISL-47 TaxID=2819130 RepID=UPI001BE66940|nr:SDR family oxidoreductase [Bacillus sp. ISL-47]MBT2687800.1 SDR family oxidoreductase [Bacillus sp. ISL-47]MBT2708123.1 SDR family oxidoreductase [Pseudomonas sp. ISL-84]